MALAASRHATIDSLQGSTPLVRVPQVQSPHSHDIATATVTCHIIGRCRPMNEGHLNVGRGDKRPHTNANWKRQSRAVVVTSGEQSGYGQ